MAWAAEEPAVQVDAIANSARLALEIYRRFEGNQQLLQWLSVEATEADRAFLRSHFAPVLRSAPVPVRIENGVIELGEGPAAIRGRLERSDDGANPVWVFNGKRWTWRADESIETGVKELERALAEGGGRASGFLIPEAHAIVPLAAAALGAYAMGWLSATVQCARPAFERTAKKAFVPGQALVATAGCAAMSTLYPILGVIMASERSRRITDFPRLLTCLYLDHVKLARYTGFKVDTAIGAKSLKLVGPSDAPFQLQFEVNGKLEKFCRLEAKIRVLKDCFTADGRPLVLDDVDRAYIGPYVSNPPTACASRKQEIAFNAKLYKAMRAFSDIQPASSDRQGSAGRGRGEADAAR